MPTLPSYRRDGRTLALPVAEAVRPNLLQSVARLDRLRDQAEDREAALPWNCATPEDALELQAWHDTWARYDTAWIKDVLMVVIPGLEEVKQVKAEKLTNLKAPTDHNPARIRDLGRALKDLDDFVTESVVPLGKRLEAGMKKLEGLPLSQEADAKHHEWLMLWISLRAEVRAMLPQAWRILVVARDLYKALDEAGQEQAVGIWGPFTGRDTADYGPLFRRSWPADRLADLDRRATLQGVVDLNHPFPNNRYGRTKKP